MRILASPADSSLESNPYVHLLYQGVRDYPGVSVDEWVGSDRRRGRWDIVHLHWPELTVSPTSPRPPAAVAKFLAELAWLRARGARVAWTAHDLRPHDSGENPWAERFYRAFTHLVDLLFVLSEKSGSEVRHGYPALNGVPTFVTPHGHYRDIYPDSGDDRQASRAALGFPQQGRVLMFFGQIRPYKNVPLLITQFLRSAGPDHYLVVAGRPHDEQLRADIEDAAGDDQRVFLRFGNVPGDQVHRYIRSADIVVLPYTAILNSGTALLALSFDRPVVVPDFGSLSELRNDVGAEWVRTYRGELSVATVNAALTDALPVGRPNLDRYDWARIASDTMDGYRSVAKRRKTSAEPRG